MQLFEDQRRQPNLDNKDDARPGYNEGRSDACTECTKEQKNFLQLIGKYQIHNIMGLINSIYTVSL